MKALILSLIMIISLSEVSFASKNCDHNLNLQKIIALNVQYNELLDLQDKSITTGVQVDPAVEDQIQNLKSQISSVLWSYRKCE